MPATLLCFLAGSLLCHAATTGGDYSQRIWRSEDGLPQNTIQAISQTSDGYLWIGTPNGLARFDGARFVAFDRSNTPEFQDDSILVLHPAGDGSLWIGSEGGGLLHYQAGRFRHFGPEEGLTNGFIRSVYTGHDGKLWVGSDRGFFRLEGDRFVRLDGTPEIPLLSVRSIAEDAGHRLWVATSIEILSVDQGRLVRHACPGPVPIAEVHALYSAPDGTLWSVTRTGPIRLQNGCGIPDPTLPRVSVNALHQDNAGNLWIGTAGQGLLRYRAGSVTTHQTPDSTVSVIFEDREQNLWAGLRDGLLRLSRTAVTTLSTRDGLTDSNVLTVYQDRAGVLWIVTLTGQLYRYEGRKLERFQGLPSGTDLVVRTVFQDRAGALWIGTSGSGAIRLFHGQSSTYTTRQGLRSNSVRQILEDGAGGIWLATGSGLSRWDGHKITNYYIEDGLSYPSVRSLALDRNGDIIAGTDGGLNRIHNLRVVPDPAFAQLSQEKIWAIHEDAGGVLWLGSRGGGLFRIKAGRLSRFTVRDGLLNDSIYQILELPRGKLWMSSPAGVSSVSMHELDSLAGGRPGAIHAVPYGTPDGMESSHMNGGMQTAGCVTASGELWFPSIRGAVRIDPGKLRASPPLNVVIENIVAGGRAVPLSGNVTIPAGHGNLEIDFTACYLLTPQRLSFKYKMEAFDDDWNPAAKLRSAHYTNVPPGHYRFRVAVTDAAAPGQTSEASVQLVWLPAFYQTSWFYALCVLACVLIGWAGLRIYAHETKARYAVLLNERIRLAREMHDTVIQGCVGVSTLLEAATRFQRTDRDAGDRLIAEAKLQVNATLDEARQAVWNLRNAPAAQNAITTLSDLAGKLGKENGIRIDTQVVGTQRDLEPVADRTLLLVAREALRNAVSHAAAHQILVRIDFQMADVCLEVTDDGQGFDCESVLNHGNGHFGIVGMRERVEQLGGRLRLKSRPGQGTSVLAQLPIHPRAGLPN